MTRGRTLFSSLRYRRSSAAPSNPNGFFGSLRSLMSARAILAMLQLVSLPILARQLELHDFAIMAMGMLIPLFANTLSDAGLGRSLVRKVDFNPVEWSSVFWFLVAVGLTLALAVIVAAPIYASFMHEPELVAVVCVLAAVPLLQALSAAHQSALERDFRFDLVSRITVLAGITGCLLAIALAWAGAGYWALVAQQVVTAGLRCLGFSALSQFRPKRAFDWELLKPHLHFGKNTLLFSTVMTMHTQAPVMAFGQIFGTAQVALWSMSERAARLARTGLTVPIAQVVLVSMSRQWRDGAGADDVARIYLSATRLIATLLFPSFIVIAIAGEATFVWLLSETWRPLALVFGLAVPTLLIEAIMSVGERLFMVADRNDLRPRVATERFLLGILALLVAMPFGFEAAVFARSLFAVAYLPRYWSFVGRCVPLDRRAAATQLAVPLLTGLVFGIAQRLWLDWAEPGLMIAALATLVVAGAAIGASGLLSWRGLGHDFTRLTRSVHIAS